MHFITSIIRAKVWDHFANTISFRKLYLQLIEHNERYARCFGQPDLFMVFYKSSFQKYWINPNIVLLIAAVLDPSMKTEFVKFYFYTGAQKVLEEILPRVRENHEEDFLAIPLVDRLLYDNDGSAASLSNFYCKVLCSSPNFMPQLHTT
ncbi:hypothetical protein ACJX0J_042491, partial [Zea mays]